MQCDKIVNLNARILKCNHLNQDTLMFRIKVLPRKVIVITFLQSQTAVFFLLFLARYDMQGHVRTDGFKNANHQLSWLWCKIAKDASGGSQTLVSQTVTIPCIHMTWDCRA